MAEDIANNRKALRDYHIVDRYEAGLELKGTEVKSIRLGHVNINDAFARIDQGAPVLHQADIQPYAKASAEQHDPRRERRLLLHKPEIEKLRSASAIEGHALVALRLYWKNGRVKVEIGVGKGAGVVEIERVLARLVGEVSARPMCAGAQPARRPWVIQGLSRQGQLGAGQFHVITPRRLGVEGMR